MQRRYQETDSNAVREELGKYQSIRSGALQRFTPQQAARNVFVGIKRSTRLRTECWRSFKLFGDLNLTGWRGEVADKVVKEIRNRLGFLADVGLDYLTLDRRPTRSPAAKRSVFALRVKSAPGWSESYISPTNPRSDCTSGTTGDSSRRSANFATWATRYCRRTRYGGHPSSGSHH
ncbi:MAG: hypothetical protein CM1200mP36_01490 [Gammaproteobacteria bacterium]|nr:MAG: hypothetical protein CM1200mP36_01490 [Gammaproteobacteria bacterium]